MGRQLDRRNGKWLEYFKAEQGYLLISTLFFLIFSGLFSHSIIKISGQQIMQLRQFATAYEAKGALNMSEELLKNYIDKNKEYPKQGHIKTSIGNIEIKQQSKEFFQLIITLENGIKFSRDVKVPINISEENLEDTKEESNLTEEDLLEEEEEIIEDEGALEDGAAVEDEELLEDEEVKDFNE